MMFGACSFDEGFFGWSLRLLIWSWVCGKEGSETAMIESGIIFFFYFGILKSCQFKRLIKILNVSILRMR